nr:MAG TPA: hypothetical protein [Caudoviricetes sp.]
MILAINLQLFQSYNQTIKQVIYRILLSEL